MNKSYDEIYFDINNGFDLKFGDQINKEVYDSIGRTYKSASTITRLRFVHPGISRVTTKHEGEEINIDFDYIYKFPVKSVFVEFGYCEIMDLMIITAYKTQ
jgi:hypothetical protein